MTEGWEGEEGRSFVLGPLGGYLFLFSFFSFSLSTVRAPVVSRLLGLSPPFIYRAVGGLSNDSGICSRRGTRYGSDCSVVGLNKSAQVVGSGLVLVLLADNLQGYPAWAVSIHNGRAGTPA